MMETRAKKIAHYMKCLEYHINSVSDYIATLRELGIDINTMDMCFREGSNGSKRSIGRFHIVNGLQDIADATGEKIIRPQRQGSTEIVRMFLAYKHLWVWRIGEEDEEREYGETENKKTDTGKASNRSDN